MVLIEEAAVVLARSSVSRRVAKMTNLTQGLFGISAVTLLACCILAVVQVVPSTTDLLLVFLVGHSVIQDSVQISVHRTSSVALASWPTALEVIPPLDSSVVSTRTVKYSILSVSHIMIVCQYLLCYHFQLL